MKYTLHVFLVATCLSFSGCLFRGTSDNSQDGRLIGNGPRGNGEGFLGAIATINNAFARCGFEAKADRAHEYEVHCRVAIKDATGNEVEAVGVEEGTILSWENPTQIAGPPISDISCQSGAQGLSQTCDVTLTPVTDGFPQRTELQFSLQPMTATLKPEPSKASVVFVSAQSYGVVPNLPGFQSVVSNQDAATGRPVGGQFPEFVADKTLFGTPGSVCTKSDRLYFATGGYIFLLQNGQARLYAGNSNLGNVNDLTSRYQVAFRFGVRVMCFEEGLVVRDSAVDNSATRLLLINDEGPVVDLVPRLGLKSSELVSGMVVRGSDNKMYSRGHKRVSGKDVWGLHRVDISTKAKDFFPTSLAYGSLAVNVQFPIAYMGAHSDGEKVFRFDLSTGETTHIAGSGVSESSDGSGPALSFGLRRIGSIVADAGGNVFVSTDRRVRKIDAAGNISTIFGADGGTKDDCSPTATNTTWANTECGITALERDSLGNIYVGLTGMMIHRVAPDGTRKRVVGYSFMSSGASKEVTDLKTSSFNTVRSVAFDGDSILFSETYGGFRRINLKTRQVEPLSLPTNVRVSAPSETRRLSAGRYFYGGPMSSALIADGSVTALAAAQVFAFGPNGKYYYGTCSWGVGNIWVQDLATTEVTLLATSEAATGLNEGGDALQAKFCSMGGLEVGQDNALYFSDHLNKRVRRIDLATRIITTIAGGGTKGLNENGWADEATLAEPYRIRQSSQGDFYFTDRGNGTIRILHPVPQENGTIRYQISTLVGKGGSDSACAGQLRHHLRERDRTAEIKTSLKAFCNSAPIGLDLRDSCGRPNGQIEIIYSQAFEARAEIFPSNVGYLTFPCQ